MNSFGGYFTYEDVRPYAAFRRTSWEDDAFVVDNGEELIYTTKDTTIRNWKPKAKDRKAKDWEVLG